MNKLWNLIDSCDFTNEGKIRTFMFFNCTIFALIGFAVWIIVRNFAFDSFEEMLCFIGYPVFFFGYLGGFIFLLR